MANKSTEAKKNPKTLEYRGDGTRFNIEEYYKILRDAFTYLSHDGPSHKLNEHQKVLKSDNGLQNSSAIRYHIDAKNEWNDLPVTEQTFDKWYNLLSAKFIKFKYIKGGTSEEYSKNKTIWINTVETVHGGWGRFVGRGGFSSRGGCGVRGNGERRRGRGRVSSYTHYFPLYANININFEDLQYPKYEFRQFSPHHKSQFQQMKITTGWINVCTPPHGIILKSDGYARSKCDICSSSLILPTSFNSKYSSAFSTSSCWYGTTPSYY